MWQIGDMTSRILTVDCRTNVDYSDQSQGVHGQGEAVGEVH